MGYTDYFLSPKNIKTGVDCVIKKIKRCNIGFDAIAFRGYSGAVISSIIAHKYKKPLVAVRKSRRSCHSNSIVENGYDLMRYIIIDDLIDTGATINSIIKNIEGHYNNTKCSAIFLYSEFGKTYDFGYKGITIPVYRCLTEDKEYILCK